MAVESNGNGTAGIPVGPPVVANGTGAVKRRKRPSSLTLSAMSLPSVEASLEEFIARANQTLVDADSWEATARQRNDEETKQREADALRMKVAEHQLREGEAREASLRRQLDAVQGKLAEAEARAALASTSSGAMQAAEALVADLRGRFERSEAKLAETVAHAREVEAELIKTKAEGSRPSTVTVRTSQLDIPETAAVDRMKVAEAKAVKALAAARAAIAGLTVSPADLAAIESGLVVTADVQTRRATPWLAIAAAFVTGLALMFGASRLLWRSSPAGAATPEEATVGEPHRAPATAAAPTVTPIEPAAAAPTITPIEAAPTAAPAPAPTIPATVEIIAPTATPVATTPSPAAPTPARTRAAPAHVASQPAAKTAHAAKSGGLADPFATTPAKTPAKQPAKAAPAKGGIADPFAN